MGFLDIIFNRGKKGQGKIFITSREIERALFQLGTLNQAQREIVKSVIAKYMGSGGVSIEEFKKRVLPELYKLVKEGKISSVDYQKLKKII